LLNGEHLDPTEASDAEPSADSMGKALVEESTDVLSTEDAQTPKPAAPEPSSNPTMGPRVNLPKVNYPPPNTISYPIIAPLAPEVTSTEGLPKETFTNLPGSEPEIMAGDRRKRLSRETPSGTLVRFLLPPKVCPLEEHKRKHQYYTCRTLRPHLRSPANLAAFAEPLIALHGPGFVFDNGVDMRAFSAASATEALTISSSSPQETASAEVTSHAPKIDARWDSDDDTDFTPEFPWKVSKQAT
jgi:hypothetical protein